MDVCICLAESLCCPPETITTLLHKMFLKNKSFKCYTLTPCQSFQLSICCQEPVRKSLQHSYNWEWRTKSEEWRIHLHHYNKTARKKFRILASLFYLFLSSLLILVCWPDSDLQGILFTYTTIRTPHNYTYPRLRFLDFYTYPRLIFSVFYTYPRLSDSTTIHISAIISKKKPVFWYLLTLRIRW